MLSISVCDNYGKSYQVIFTNGEGHNVKNMLESHYRC